MTEIEALLREMVDHCWVFEDRFFVCHYCCQPETGGHLMDCVVLRAQTALYPKTEGEPEPQTGRWQHPIQDPTETNRRPGRGALPGPGPDDWAPSGYGSEYQPWDTFRKLMHRNGVD